MNISFSLLITIPGKEFPKCEYQVQLQLHLQNLAHTQTQYSHSKLTHKLKLNMALIH